MFTFLLFTPLFCGHLVQEGQLSVGDHILSIDGESVVGPGVALQQVRGCEGLRGAVWAVRGCEVLCGL